MNGLPPLLSSHDDEGELFDDVRPPLLDNQGVVGGGFDCEQLAVLVGEDIAHVAPSSDRRVGGASRRSLRKRTPMKVPPSMVYLSKPTAIDIDTDEEEDTFGMSLLPNRRKRRPRKRMATKDEVAGSLGDMPTLQCAVDTGDTSDGDDPDGQGGETNNHIAPSTSTNLDTFPRRQEQVQPVKRAKMTLSQLYAKSLTALTATTSATTTIPPVVSVDATTPTIRSANPTAARLFIDRASRSLAAKWELVADTVTAERNNNTAEVAVEPVASFDDTTAATTTAASVDPDGPPQLSKVQVEKTTRVRRDVLFKMKTITRAKEVGVECASRSTGVGEASIRKWMLREEDIRRAIVKGNAASLRIRATNNTSASAEMEIRVLNWVIESTADGDPPTRMDIQNHALLVRNELLPTPGSRLFGFKAGDSWISRFAIKHKAVLGEWLKVRGINYAKRVKYEDKVPLDVLLKANASAKANLAPAKRTTEKTTTVNKVHDEDQMRSMPNTMVHVSRPAQQQQQPLIFNSHQQQLVVQSTRKNDAAQHRRQVKQLRGIAPKRGQSASMVQPQQMVGEQQRQQLLLSHVTLQQQPINLTHANLTQTAPSINFYGASTSHNPLIQQGASSTSTSTYMAATQLILPAGVSAYDLATGQHIIAAQQQQQQQQLSQYQWYQH